MPRCLQIFLKCFFCLALHLVVSGRTLAQDVWVAAGQPVALTATSGYGAAVDTPCGPDMSYSCYGATQPPNGNIHWTVDGASASSSYDTVVSSGTWCSSDNVNIYTYCYVYWDESGFYSVLSPGDHVVTASIPTSQDYSAAFSTTWYVHVAKFDPSLSVSCSPNPITYGSQTSTCTAQTSAGSGTISTYWDGNGWCSGAAPGPVTCTGWNGQQAGNHTFSASYSGDSNYNFATASVGLTINKSTPSVTVSCSPNPRSYGASNSCTAHVSEGGGSVTFSGNNGTWNIGLDGNGNAVLSGFSDWPVGDNTVQATYNGDSNHNPASSSTILTVGKATPSISVTCSPTTLKVGQQTTCTASVPGATGIVSFYTPTTLTGQWWNGNAGSWYPPSGGNLSDSPFAITNDGALNYNLSNSGSPSGWPGAADGPVGLNHDYFYVRWTGTFVSSIAGAYTIGLNSDDGANLYVNGTQLVSNLGTGQGAAGNLTYTQSGTINLTAGAINTIVVEFQQGAGDSGIQLLWTTPGASSPSTLGWSAVPLDSGGHASISGPILVAGNATVTAAYSGDGTYNSATASTSLTATANTVVELSGDINPSNVGQGVTYTTLVHTGGAKPSANVEVRDTGSPIGSVGVNAVTATNLLAYSQQVGSGSWSGYCGATSNMTSNTFDFIAPDGSYTATKFVAPSSFICGSTPSWGALTNIPGGLQEGKTYTASVWLRGADGGESVNVALNDCAQTSVTLTTSWKRYVATYPSIPSGIANCGTGSRGFQVLDVSSPNATYYVWGAQLEMSEHAGAYIQTDASSRSGYGGIASFTTNSLSPGTHLVTAHYVGDSMTAAGMSPGIAQVVGTVSGGPPNIGWLSPTSGYPGTSVTINGLNFGASQGSSVVTFNGLSVSATSWSDTSITVHVPVNATSGNVIVTVNGVGSNGVVFTVDSLPSGMAIYSYEIKDSNGNTGYSPNGNITAYSDSVNGVWSDIGHDSLNRLTSATQAVNGFTQHLCWSYDAFGNRRAQATASSPCNNPSPTVSYSDNNRIQGLIYDSSGNLTNDGTNQFFYDTEGRICAVQYHAIAGGPAMMMGYLYDAEGRRVAKGTLSQWSCDLASNGFQETRAYLLGPAGEQMTETDDQGNWIHTNVYANGALIATYTPNDLSFHLNDWLGTRRLDTDVRGNSGASYQSLPFGDLLNPSQIIASPEHLFTGKERDAESGLDYFGARYYASNMGRWMSPDWAATAMPVPYAKLDNPQSLNLYSYVGNNPLIRIDKDGHYWSWLQGACNIVEKVYHGVFTDYGFKTNAQVSQVNEQNRQWLIKNNVVTPDKNGNTIDWNKASGSQIRGAYSAAVGALVLRLIHGPETLSGAALIQFAR